MNNPQLSNLTVKQLRQLARQRGIPLTGLTRKADIINALNRGQSPVARQEESAKGRQQESAKGRQQESAKGSQHEKEQGRQQGRQQERKQNNFKHLGSVLLRDSLVIGDIDSLYRFFSLYKNRAEMIDVLGLLGVFGGRTMKHGRSMLISTEVGSDVVFDISAKLSDNNVTYDTFMLKEN